MRDIIYVEKLKIGILSVVEKMRSDFMTILIKRPISLLLMTLIF